MACRSLRSNGKSQSADPRADEILLISTGRTNGTPPIPTENHQISVEGVPEELSQTNSLTVQREVGYAATLIVPQDAGH